MSCDHAYLSFDVVKVLDVVVIVGMMTNSSDSRSVVVIGGYRGWGVVVMGK